MIIFTREHGEKKNYPACFLIGTIRFKFIMFPGKIPMLPFSFLNKKIISKILINTMRII